MADFLRRGGRDQCHRGIDRRSGFGQRPNDAHRGRNHQLVARIEAALDVGFLQFTDSEAIFGGDQTFAFACFEQMKLFCGLGNRFIQHNLRAGNHWSSRDRRGGDRDRWRRALFVGMAGGDAFSLAVVLPKHMKCEEPAYGDQVQDQHHGKSP